MLYKQPIHLYVANSQGFEYLHDILFFLAMLAALLSSQPWLLVAGVVVYFVTTWLLKEFSNTVQKTLGQNKQNLTLIIFPDGRVRVCSESTADIEGRLGQRHWITKWLAVLEIVYEDKTRRLVVPAHIQAVHQFRRISIWVGHDIFQQRSEKYASGGQAARPGF